MATSDPIGTIDKGGSPGRPATVRRTAEKLITLELYLQLIESGLVAPGMPKKSLVSFTRKTSGAILDALVNSNLHVIPGQIVNDLSLLVGKGALENDEEVQAGVFRSGDGSTTTGNLAAEDAGVSGPGGLEGSAESITGDTGKAGEVAE